MEGGKKTEGDSQGRDGDEGGEQNQMRRRPRPLEPSPSLIKVVKGKGKLVVGRVEGDPRCLADFCLWPVWWNRLRDKLRESAVCHPSHTYPPVTRTDGHSSREKIT